MAKVMHFWGPFGESGLSTDWLVECAQQKKCKKPVDSKFSLPYFLRRLWAVNRDIWITPQSFRKREVSGGGFFVVV